MVVIEGMFEVVYELYVFLLDKMDVELVVECNGYGWMLFIYLGECIKMMIQFCLDGWKWCWECFFLWIDGECQFLVVGWDMYILIYKDFDNGCCNYVFEGVKKVKLLVLQLVDEQYLLMVIVMLLRSVWKVVGGVIMVMLIIVFLENQYLFMVDNVENGEKVVIIFGYDGFMWYVVDLMVINLVGYDIFFLVDLDQFEMVVVCVLGIVNVCEVSFFVLVGGLFFGVVFNLVVVCKVIVFWV